MLNAKLAEDLMISPVTQIELAPAFAGHMEAIDEFLFQLGINRQGCWTTDDTLNASIAWTRHLQKRRLDHVPKRPIADVLIGAFAQHQQGLLTRNVADFRKLFPSLKIISG